MDSNHAPDSGDIARGYIKVCLYDIPNMADSEPPTALMLTNMFPTIMRYMIMLMLYVIVFTQFKKPNIQFILFIIVFILNFFTILFLYKEFISTPLLIKSFFEVYTERDPPSSRNWMTKFFVGIIGLTALLFICSLSIILVVFDYGKKSTNDFKSYVMTPNNKLLLDQFKTAFRTYMIYLTIFVFFMIYAHTEGAVKKFMFNFASGALSIVLMVTSSYCCVAAVKFLDNKKHHRQLYQ
jgi:hypothetical protein